MFGFYNIFKGGQEPSPSAMVKPTSTVQTQSRRKIKILAEHPFVSTLQLALQDASNLLQTQIQAVACVCTDAAKDDCFNPSIHERVEEAGCDEGCTVCIPEEVGH